MCSVNSIAICPLDFDIFKWISWPEAGESWDQEVTKRFMKGCRKFDQNLAVLKMTIWPGSGVKGVKFIIWGLWMLTAKLMERSGFDTHCSGCTNLYTPLDIKIGLQVSVFTFKFSCRFRNLDPHDIYRMLAYTFSLLRLWCGADLTVLIHVVRRY